MALICLDTSVLIDHKRASIPKKEETFLYKLSEHHSFAVTAISVFELLRGDNQNEDKFWLNVFSKLQILPFDFESSQIAGQIDKELIKKGTKIKITDLFIG